MAPGDLVQSAADTGTSPTAGLPAASTPGNTLVAITGHRSEDGTPSLSGDDWILVAHYKTLIADLSHRRAVAVFAKPADGQQSVQATWSPSRTNALVVREFEGEFDPDSLVDSVGDSGADAVDTLATGATPAVPDADSLAITAAVWRRGDVIPTWQSPYGDDVNVFTGGGTTLLEVGGASTLVSAVTEADVIWSSARTATCTHAVIVLAPAGVMPGVGRSATLGWDVRAVTVREADLTWDAREVVGRSAELNWDVQATATVGRSAEMGWSTRQIVGHGATLAWSIETAPTPEPLIDIHVVALAPVMPHPAAPSPEIQTRTATSPQLRVRTALAPDIATREPGNPALGHGDTGDPDLGHGNPDTVLGHGDTGAPTT